MLNGQLDVSLRMIFLCGLARQSAMHAILKVCVQNVLRSSLQTYSRHQYMCLMVRHRSCQLSVSLLRMDRLDKETRSRNMSAVKAKDTTPELIVRRNLFKGGIRYRLHLNDLPG